MGRRWVPAVLVLALGCGPTSETRFSFTPPIVEWHSSLRLYSNELCEDVVVWADGRIETRSEARDVKRIVLSSPEMDRLFVLLSDVEFLQGDVLDERLRVCPAEPREPEVVRDVLLVYSPRPGLRRELRRSWGDGALDGIAFTREYYGRLELLDRFFRELLPD